MYHFRQISHGEAIEIDVSKQNQQQLWTAYGLRAHMAGKSSNTQVLHSHWSFSERSLSMNGSRNLAGDDKSNGWQQRIYSPMILGLGRNNMKRQPLATKPKTIRIHRCNFDTYGCIYHGCVILCHIKHGLATEYNETMRNYILHGPQVLLIPTDSFHSWCQRYKRTPTSYMSQLAGYNQRCSCLPSPQQQLQVGIL